MKKKTRSSKRMASRYPREEVLETAIYCTPADRLTKSEIAIIRKYTFRAKLTGNIWIPYSNLHGVVRMLCGSCSLDEAEAARILFGRQLLFILRQETKHPCFSMKD